MASHLSVVKEVLGLPAADALLLEEHDDYFFNDQDTASSESSSDEDPLESPPAAAATDPSGSSDEENLDLLDTAERSTASLQEALAAEWSAKRRCSQEPSTLQQVLDRSEEGCKCAGDKNCFLLLAPELLLATRRMTEAVDPHLRETYLAGTLDALARRGRTAHAGQSHGVSDRA